MTLPGETSEQSAFAFMVGNVLILFLIIAWYSAFKQE